MPRHGVEVILYKKKKEKTKTKGGKTITNVMCGIDELIRKEVLKLPSSDN